MHHFLGKKDTLIEWIFGKSQKSIIWGNIWEFPQNEKFSEKLDFVSFDPSEPAISCKISEKSYYFWEKSLTDYTTSSTSSSTSSTSSTSSSTK